MPRKIHIYEDPNVARIFLISQYGQKRGLEMLARLPKGERTYSLSGKKRHLIDLAPIALFSTRKLTAEGARSFSHNVRLIYQYERGYADGLLQAKKTRRANGVIMPMTGGQTPDEINARREYVTSQPRPIASEAV